MGELRSGSVSKEDSLWARYNTGELKAGDGRKAETEYNLFQIGYDKAFEQANGVVYRGVAVSHADGDTSFERGSGEADETTLSLYQSWKGNKGHYYDVIAKAGRYSNEYSLVDKSDKHVKGDSDVWAYSISGEYGYRQNLADGFYIEPQAELLLGHIGSDTYTNSLGVKVKADSQKAAITRLGVAVGKEFEDKGSVFAKASYYHDFAGGLSVTGDDIVSYERDNPRNWASIVLGGTTQLSKASTLYAEAEKLYGDLESNVQFNVGFRYSF